MIPTTPVEITPPIQRLCKRLTRATEPVYVPVDPVPGATPNSCFSNVAAKVAAAGGSQVLGWTIWATAVMVEAEFHAVWRSPVGELVDVSPRPHGEKQTLFLADPSCTYEGRQVNNIREPVFRNDVLVERFIKVNNQIFDVMNRGSRADRHGMVSVPADEIAPLLLKKERLGLELMRRRTDPDAPCVCGSTKKLKNCCS